MRQETIEETCDNVVDVITVMYLLLAWPFNTQHFYVGVHYARTVSFLVSCLLEKDSGCARQPRSPPD